MIVVHLRGGILNIGIRIPLPPKKIGTIKLKRIERGNSDFTLFNLGAHF